MVHQATGSDDTVQVQPVGHAPDVAVEEKKAASSFSLADIRHNMIVCIMLDAIFFTGFADLNLAMQPLLVYLHATNFMIGAVASAQFMGLLGVFLSPWISRRFRQKKWYLFIVNIPYLLPLGLIGCGLVFSKQMDVSNSTLLYLVFGLTLVHWLFGGFCSLPHQEYVAACIPMSHRGRYTGFSFAIGGVASIASAAVGGLILLHVSKPMAFGYLFLMTWAICQAGYFTALFAREQPTPVEKAPKPWSKDMLVAFWHDKPFVRFMVLTSLIAILVNPVFAFVNVYGFKVLGMVPATAAVIQIITQVVRIGVSVFVGIFTDKVGPKKVFPYLPLLAVLSLVPPLFIHNSLGVYISVAVSTLYVAGLTACFTALAYGLPKPEHRAGHYTIQIILNYIAASVGPLIFGKACDLLPYHTVFIITAVLALVFYPISLRMLKILSNKQESYS